MKYYFRKLTIGIPWVILLLFSYSCGDDIRNKPLFVNITESKTKINFSNNVVENDSINILEYLSAYNGAGIGAGDFNNDGLIDLYFVSNQQENKLYLNRGDFRFEDITSKAKVEGLSGVDTWSNGVTLVDINGDGWLDIYVCMMNGHLGLKGVNQFFINNHDETFTEQAGQYGLDFSSYAQHAAFFDYDKDGDLDMYLLNQAVHTKESFMPAATRNSRDPMSGDKLLENTNGKYIDVSEKAGIYGGAMGYGLSVSTGDLNNDGWPDVYVSNDFHENDYLYYNRGNGTFREDIMGSAGHVSKSSMGNDLGDFDNDGDIDIVTLDMKPPDEEILKQTSGVDPHQVYKYKMDIGYYYQFSRNMLQQNLGKLFEEGGVQFSEIGQMMGVADTDWSWSGVFADLDNDGLKDLFISNGIPKRPNSLDYRKLVNQNMKRAEATPSDELIALMPEGRSRNFAFQNTGERFLNVSKEWGLDLDGYSNGVVMADLDNDGDLDLIINNLNAEATVYRNQTSEKAKKHFIKISLSKDDKSYYAPGTKIMVAHGDKTQLQELKSTSGWLSSYSGDLVFGLDKAENEINVKVIWPDNKAQNIKVQTPDVLVKIKYEDASYEKQDLVGNSTQLFLDVTHKSGIGFVHQENEYMDFSVEPLMPHFLSTQGPGLTVGDVNGDGLDDFFVGGGKQQQGKIFLGTSAGGAFFHEGNNSIFQQHRLCEDIGACLSDVDNDGDLDLYVASGGGELGSSELLIDRLYINDGVGNFHYVSNGLPEIAINSSCVVPLDANEDGFIDLFIGNRSIPGKYGMTGESKLLINNGQGNFEDATSRYFDNNGKIGMVTDADWIPETRELVVVGEWMPIKIFTISPNGVSILEIPNSTGWWNTTYASDLDSDGDVDFIAGNAGLNTELTATPEQPVELYVKDFDGNLTIEPIIVYSKNGKRWVYPGLDELSLQMPALRQVFPVYHLYAKKTFEDLFPSSLLNGSNHVQAVVSASCIIENTGQGYQIRELPLMSQVSPIFGFISDDFDKDGAKDILAVGNLKAYQPGLGAQDASFGAFLKGNGNLDFEYIPPKESGFAVRGEARDIKIVVGSNEKRRILISRNNASVCLLE